MTIKCRIEKLERIPQTEFFEIQKLISQGAYYDELSDEQKEKYRKYKESIGGVADDLANANLEIMFLGKSEKEAFHFQLSQRKRPPTEEEHRKNVAEVEDFVLRKTKEYEEEIRR